MSEKKISILINAMSPFNLSLDAKKFFRILRVAIFVCIIWNAVATLAITFRIIAQLGRKSKLEWLVCPLLVGLKQKCPLSRIARYYLHY